MAHDVITLTTPGELLYKEFMQPLGISAYRLAKDIGVPLTRITAILQGKRAISPETAYLLSQYFQMSEPFFMNLQSYYDLERAKEKLKNHPKRIIPFPRPDLPELHYS
jgi:addiction module HigA family antidote